MTTAQRRDALLARLNRAKDEPISASALAKEFSVSRQIIVGDIALLRAAGADISATPRGYLLRCASNPQQGMIRIVACRHTSEQTEAELDLIVDQGAEVLDVAVEHPVYGELVGQLRLRSRYDVSQFIETSQKSDAGLLSQLTGGLHLHHLRCPSEETYQRILSKLEEAGFLVKE